jgi:CheY-specific phosphatase CheX
MANMQKIPKILMESTFEVFEKMYYLFLEPLDPEKSTYDMAASIGFRGQIGGEIRILISNTLVAKMVQNMLSLKGGDVTMKLKEDCLKESVNMICGNFLCKFDPSQVFNLALPAFEGNGVVDYREPGTVFRLAFESEGEVVGVNLRMTDQAL